MPSHPKILFHMLFGALHSTSRSLIALDLSEQNVNSVSYSWESAFKKISENFVEIFTLSYVNVLHVELFYYF